jgi:hypothetical protein
LSEGRCDDRALVGHTDVHKPHSTHWSFISILLFVKEMLFVGQYSTQLLHDPFGEMIRVQRFGSIVNGVIFLSITFTNLKIFIG